MNEIKIQNVSVKFSQYKWDPTKANSYDHDTDIKDFEAIDASEYDQFKRDFFENKILTLNKFDENDKVYFHSSVTFSRSKFRELFPKTKVTYSMENADAIIVDKENLNRQFNIWHSRLDLYPSITGAFYCSMSDSPFAIQGAKKISYIRIEEKKASRYSMNKEHLNFVNFLITSKSKFVDVNTIALKSELIIDDDTYFTLDKLLASNNPQNMQLACTMLSAFDYGASAHRMALLLKVHAVNWYNYREKKTFIDLKTVLHRLNKDYPFLGANYGNSLGDGKFWYPLFSEHSDDNIVHAHFHDWLNKSLMCEENNIEFLLSIKGKDDTFVFDISNNLPIQERIELLNQQRNVLENTTAEIEISQEAELQMSGELSL
jgi:hypothetical protein